LVLRSTTLAFTAILAFLLYPAWKGSNKKVHLIDILLIIMTLIVWVYLLFEHSTITYRAGVMPKTLDVVFGTFMLITVLEMCRRTTGPILTGFAIVVFLYALWGSGLPGVLSHVGYSYKRTISYIFGYDGTYGFTLGVVPTYVMVFVVFGAFMEKCGGIQMVLELSKGLAGRARGGPAKIAIIASSLMGTISGSTVANVVATGSITIPMMKKTGYRAPFAGAIETAASSGGQIMPPVMGAAAFIMAEILAVPYVTIARMALIPAIMYYISLYWIVDLEAQKSNLRGLPKEQIPDVRKILRSHGHLLIPIIVLVVVLVLFEMSPIMAGLIATVSCIVVSWFRKETRIGLKDILVALRMSGEGLISIAAAASVAGVLIGVLALTGTGIKLGIGLLSYTGGLLFSTLFLTMILALIMGCGQPSIAAYIVSATVAAPALIKIGVDPIAAHLFVFYFATFSNVTPPVAVASFVAATLAQTPPMRVALIGLRLCLAGFLIPYIFVISPGLLLQDSFIPTLMAIARTLIGIVALGSALQGWFITNLNWWQRLIMFVAAGLTLYPDYLADVLGVAIITIIFVLQRRQSQRSRQKELQQAESVE
jgi:TRAP transporter 4TM/12TM fusion protein